jgi:Response regulator containing a CheY-like receiver domain and an HTH DNA-binding domain
MLRQMPQMLREILEHALADEDDMELVPSDRKAPAPDVVLLGTSRPDDDSGATALLARWPNARILAIETRGGHSRMYELRPHSVDLGPLSTLSIADTIRAALRGEAKAVSREPWGSDW